jgi:DNA-binding CsgD family transcriptional regulator
MPETTTPTNPATARILAALAPLIDAREAAMLTAIDRLSPQERAVFVLIGHGQRAKEVAWELAISAKTVETHLARIRAKLAAVGEGEAPDLQQLTFLARLWVRASAVGNIPT